MIIKLNDTIKAVTGVDATDGNDPLTIRVALLNLFHYHRCTPKESYLLHNVVQEVLNEKVTEIDTDKLGSKKTQFIQNVVKENHGPIQEKLQQPFYLSFFQVQLMIAVGLTENDV